MSSQLLLQSLQDFYADPHYHQAFLEIMKGTTPISLRSIDWFITNYSKKHNNYYLIYLDAEGYPTRCDQEATFKEHLNVHQSYKAQLKSYSKKTFDPFCRRDRINFEMGEETVDTTVGQLNFFRWALSHLVIDYILENKDVIETDMNESLHKIKEKGKEKKEKSGSRKKREQLSVSATRGLSKTNVSVTIVFE